MNINQIRKEINDWLSQNFHKIKYGELVVTVKFHDGNIRLCKRVEESSYYPAGKKLSAGSTDNSVSCGSKEDTV